jgi:hypothetical protein
MRALFVLLVTGLVVSGVAAAQTPQPTVVNLDCKPQWEMPATPDLASFRTYMAPTSKGYTKGSPVKTLGPQIPPTATTTYTATCRDFGVTTYGTYYLAVTAVDKAGLESDFSREAFIQVVDTTPPDVPSGFRVTTITVSPPATP